MAKISEDKVIEWFKDLTIDQKINYCDRITELVADEVKKHKDSLELQVELYQETFNRLSNTVTQ